MLMIIFKYGYQILHPELGLKGALHEVLGLQTQGCMFKSWGPADSSRNAEG